MTRLTRLYHADLGIPDDVPGPEGGSALRYTVHAIRAAQADRIENILPATLPLTYQLVEVETLDGMPVKWVVRARLDAERDLVMVITHNYVVRTVWVNRVDDQHATLRTERYTQVNAQEA